MVLDWGWIAVYLCVDCVFNCTDKDAHNIRAIKIQKMAFEPTNSDNFALPSWIKPRIYNFDACIELQMDRYDRTNHTSEHFHVNCTVFFLTECV